MAFSAGHMDTLVKEFLLFRGFTSTLKAFDSELRWARGRDQEGREKQ